MFVSDGSLTAHTTVKVVVSEFVIPESPIGILALVGAALAALGAFVVLQRRRNNNVGDYTGSLDWESKSQFFSFFMTSNIHFSRLIVCSLPKKVKGHKRQLS